MIKIINGKIVTQGGCNSPIGSPRIGRRSSLQELQLKEFQLQQELKQKEAAQQEQQEAETPEMMPSWKELSCQSIRVFGMKVNIKVLLSVALLSVLGAGTMGLLCTLLAVYLGTLFTASAISPSTSKNSPSPPSTPVEQQQQEVIATTSTRCSTPPMKSCSTPPINAGKEILTRRNSISNGIIVARPPSSPLSSPISMRSPRFATLRSIAEVEKLPMLDTPAC